MCLRFIRFVVVLVVMESDLKAYANNGKNGKNLVVVLVVMESDLKE